MGEERRHFSREFKRDAVQLVTEKEMPVGKVARESKADCFVTKDSSTSNFLALVESIYQSKKEIK